MNTAFSIRGPRAFTWLLVIALAALAAAWAGGPAAASAKRRPPPSPGPLVLHPKFRRAGSAADVMTDGRYVFIARTAPSVSGTLIDQQTGRRTVVSRPGCAPVALGGPWLLFTCGNGQPPTVELYGLATGQWQPVTLAPFLQKYCGSSGGEIDCYPIAVGAAWIEFSYVACGSDPQKCSYRDVFQNLQTGQFELVVLAFGLSRAGEMGEDWVVAC